MAENPLLSQPDPGLVPVSLGGGAWRK